MSSEKKRPTDEDLLAQLGALGDDTEIAKKAPPTVQGQQQSEADLLAELGIPERQKPTSRPHTPRLQSSSTTPASKNSPKRAGFATPTSNEGARTSEDKAVPRKSGESTRSFHRPSSFTLKAEAEIEPEPEEKRPDKEEVQSGGGWWGGIFATASAAVKHAEALAKEIQHNEEAQRWAEQVKGNVGALRGFGMLLSIALQATSTHKVIQEENFDPEPSQPLPTFFIPSPLRFLPTNVSKSTSLTILSATHPSTPSSTKPSPA